MRFIPVSEPVLSGNEKRYVMDCIDSNWISSLGKYVERFEKNFAEFCGCKCGVAVANGTVALQLALTALGVKEGEVIVPSLTFVATANAVKYVGARPVFADSERETWCISPKDVKKKVTEKTKAIIPVHLYGHPADMDTINEIAKQHNLFVIEDAAEAHGALYKGRHVGSLGDVSCFSFYGNKIITTGEGGMCVTDNKELADEMRFLKDHSMDPKKRYWHPKIGFNFRMTNIQAAIGVAQLEQIDKFIKKREEHERLYRGLLKDIKGISFQPKTGWASPVYWMHSVLIEKEFGVSRDDVMKKLRAAGIDSRPFFYPNHVLPPYDTKEKLPVAEEIAAKGINLPSSVKLSEEDIKRICNEIKRLKNG